MMEEQEPAKYQKLAQEYSKLRAQANVLKKAVIEEQNKSGCLRETVRLKEVELRRTEQELDSLNFRNRQLEHRVANLQSDLEKQTGGKQTKKTQQNHNNNNNTTVNGGVNNLNGLNNNNHIFVVEELQKKIIENANLSQELDMCQRLIKDLQDQVAEQASKQSSIEDNLRQEIHQLNLKNSDLEVKMLELGRANSEDDGLSVTDSSVTDSHTATDQDRIHSLERELANLRVKYDLLKATTPSENSSNSNHSTESSSALLCDHVQRKVEDLFLEKSLAESKLHSYMTECDSLRDNVEILVEELRQKDCRIADLERDGKRNDDHLQTTRQNYEEQISVLTEQVLLLSDQLAKSN